MKLKVPELFGSPDEVSEVKLRGSVTEAEEGNEGRSRKALDLTLDINLKAMGNHWRAFNQGPKYIRILGDHLGGSVIQGLVGEESENRTGGRETS